MRKYFIWQSLPKRYCLKVNTLSFGKFIFLFCFATTAQLGCGVKGKPLPPLRPTPIGDGKLLGEKHQLDVSSKNKIQTDTKTTKKVDLGEESNKTSP